MSLTGARYLAQGNRKDTQADKRTKHDGNDLFYEYGWYSYGARQNDESN
jgi:hypothetical protein